LDDIYLSRQGEFKKQGNPAAIPTAGTVNTVSPWTMDMGRSKEAI